MAELNYLPQQLSSLIVNPIKLATVNDHEVYYIIVIDAFDKRSPSEAVETLIKIVLDGVAEIPLNALI